MLFWTLTAALVAFIALLFVLALVRRQPQAAAPAAAYDVQVYRDQLRDLDRDLARGVMGNDEAERTRIEISRRMLEADRTAQKAVAPSDAPRPATTAVLLGLAAVMGGSFGLYQWLGSAGYPDQPIAERFAMADELYGSRPSQDDAEKAAAAQRGPLPTPEPQFAELMERLRKAVADRPNDVQGLELLARNEANMGNFRAGWEAQRRLIALRGDAATAADYAQLGEYLTVAAGGLVTKDAEAAFAAALEKDPRDALSRYYIGLMMAQNARGDRAFRVWDAMLRDGTPEGPWMAPIRANIEQLAWIAGETRYQMPQAGGRGPTAEDMQAAAQMTPEERQQMIRGMVEQLNDRLASEGGPATEWAKLISSLRMLGDEERAQNIWTEAQGRFAEAPDDLALIRQAAEGEVTQMPMAAPQAQAPMMPGPSAEQMQSAAQMTPEDRQQMIEGMVNGLVERLTTEGGAATEWARAISSLATLGKVERAAEVFAAAKTALAGDDAALAMVEAAANSAGVAQ
jgi:cytochrome c-type biogenesis protein CcmH